MLDMTPLGWLGRKTQNKQINPQTNTDAFANSVDPDEMAHNEPSHQDLHYLPFCSWILIDIPILNSWFDQIQRWRIPPHKLRGETVKSSMDWSLLKAVWLQDTLHDI